MADDPTKPPESLALARENTGLSRQRSELATDRTLMATDRTLMAWTRTSLAMISFGFTIYKFLESMKAEGALPGLRPEGPRNFGLALVILGVGSLAVASFQYWSMVRQLGRAEHRSPWTLTLIVACLIILMGVLVLASMLLHSGPF
jgi:putative membrane protein